MPKLDRTEKQHRYYLANQEKLRLRQRTYYANLKKDPVAYLGFIEKSRLYKRKKFGWKRTYKIRVTRLKGALCVYPT